MVGLEEEDDALPFAVEEDPERNKTGDKAAAKRSFIGSQVKVSKVAQARCLEVKALPHLPGPDNLVFRRREFRQGEGAAAVEFLGADAHLGAEAEFCAVGEAG